MKRETIFISCVATTLLTLPALLNTSNSLTSGIVTTVSLLALLVIADRRINREHNDGNFQPCLAPINAKEH